jgi:hypothetical protein
VFWKRYKGTDVPKRVQISVFSQFASPETGAELYQQTLREEGMPWDACDSGAIEWTTADARLTMVLVPTETYESERVPLLTEIRRG